jgi:Lipase (class 3)
MADMAENIWQASGDEIVSLFKCQELRDFGFTIVGHSLGAGTACLLNVKIFQENLLPSRNLRCFAFAPPPTLSIGTVTPPRVQEAINSTIAYIHDADCVPFLSVGSLQRLVALFKAVDKNTEHIWAYRRFLMFWEWEEIPNAIIQDVKAAEELSGNNNNNTNTVVLEIPAGIAVWMRPNFTGSRFEAFGCDPKDLARINLQVSQDMLTDHLVEPYEDCLDDLALQFN